MGVTKGGVGDEQPPAFADPFGELFRPQLEQQIAGAFWNRALRIKSGRFGYLEDFGRLETFCIGAAVGNDVAQETDEFRGAIATGLEGIELGSVIDQGGGGLALGEDPVV